MKALCCLLLTLFPLLAWSQMPLVLGTTTTLHSGILNEDRPLNIYLPEGYNKNDTTRYPVIYLLDGSVDEDFIHVAGIVQFSTFSWVNRLPKSILVGIANIDRKRDFTFPSHSAHDKELVKNSGGSSRFIEFIDKELIPFVEKNYNATTSRTIIGESLGGLLATEILFRKPSLFSQYVIVSPSLWWDNGSLLQYNINKPAGGAQPLKYVYLAVGKEGLTPSQPPRVMEVDANLLADKLRKEQSNTIRLFMDYLPEEDHATIMHQAVLNAVKWLHSVR